MRLFRFVVRLVTVIYYSMTSTLWVMSTVWIMPQAIHESLGKSRGHILISLGMELAIAVYAVVFVVVLWSLLRQKALGRRWVIAASLLNLALGIGFPLSIWGASGFWAAEKVFWIPVAFGIAGLFALPREHSAAAEAQASPPG